MYEIEKTADWHYNTGLLPANELQLIAKVDTSSVNDVLPKLIEKPYEFGGIKRVHSGDPAVVVDNAQISRRSRHMRQIGYTAEHYFIEFNNDVVDTFAMEQKKKFNLAYEHHCLIIVPPGQCMPVHGDTYSYLMRFMKKENPEVQYDLSMHARRFLTFLGDWNWGQCLGAGNAIEWQWKTGYTYEWEHKLIHWCANAGFEPMVFFEITGLEL